MSKIPGNEIINSILKGIENAQTNCRYASNSLLRQVPEYLTTVNVYQSLFKLIKEHFKPNERDLLTFEVKASSIQEYLPRSRKHKSFSAMCRCDVALWHDDGEELRAVIEIKKDVKHWQSLSNDIKRLISLGDDGLDLAISASAIYEKLGKDKKHAISAINRYLNNKAYEVNNIVSNHSNESLSVESIPGQSRTISLINYHNNTRDTWLWQPVCFKIFRR